MKGIAESWQEPANYNTVVRACGMRQFSEHHTTKDGPERGVCTSGRGLADADRSANQ